MSKMNWLEWLHAEGYSENYSKTTQEALSTLLEKQREFQSVLPYMQAQGLRKSDPMPVDIAVTLVTTLGEQGNAELNAVVQILLDLIRSLESRIAELERRCQ